MAPLAKFHSSARVGAEQPAGALSRIVAIAVAATLSASGAWAQSGSGLFDPLGPIAELQRLELVWASIIILVAILPVLLGVPLILWRYRRANTKSEYAPAWHFDTKLEIVMWVVPVVIVIALGIWLTQATYRIDPYREIDAEMAEGMEFVIDGPPVEVEVVGLDWKWLYIYPEEGVASVGEMVLPVASPVSMRLTTDTVMQSFMAPGLAGQIYAMPGMVTRLNLLADREGETLAGNTQYNGTGFAWQRGPVRAVDRAAYDAFLDEARDSPELDDRTYARLAASGTVDDARQTLGREGDGPLVFSLPDERLFDRIVSRYRTGTAVAIGNQPGSPSYDPETASLPDTPLEMSHGQTEGMDHGSETRTPEAPGLPPESHAGHGSGISTDTEGGHAE